MPPSEMDGIRNFEFTVGTDVLELEDTDFYIEYFASASAEQQPELRLRLNGVWQHSDFSEAVGLARRAFVEARLKELTWDFVGRKGTLVIDKGTAQEVTLTDITLLNVSPDSTALNDLIEYSLEFAYPISSTQGAGGTEIARKLVFALLPMNLLERTEEFHSATEWQPQVGTTVDADVADGPAALITVSGNADRINDNSAVASGNIIQQIAVPNDTRSYEVGVYVKKEVSPASYPGLRMALVGGAPEVDTRWTLDHENGSAVLNTGNADGLKRIDDLGDYWRYVLRGQNNKQSNTFLRVQIYASVNTDAGSSWIVNTQGSVIVWGAHVAYADPDSERVQQYIRATTAPVLTEIEADAQNFLFDRSREDRTNFKPVFRAPQVRVATGKGLETLAVTGIKELTSGSTPTPLELRQDAEAKLKIWTDLIGEEGILFVDEGDAGEVVQQAHLQDARGSDYTLPDSFIFDLVFRSGYAR